MSALCFNMIIELKPVIIFMLLSVKKFQQIAISYPLFVQQYKKITMDGCCTVVPIKHKICWAAYFSFVLSGFIVINQVL